MMSVIEYHCEGRQDPMDWAALIGPAIVIASTRTTKLYNRRRDEVNLYEVERIFI